MEIVLATRNRNKVKEITAKLKDLKVKLLTLDDFKNFPEVIEDRPTIEGNAVKKAHEVCKRTGYISLADDTGLEVTHLKGGPGVYSARFAGEGCTYKDNNKKVLKLLKCVPSSKRTAIFRTIIAVCVPGEKPVLVEGRCNGRIAFEIKGKKGFGYDPVFIPDGYKKNYAEMALSFKNKISHRGKALDKAKKVIQKIMDDK